MNDKLFEEAFEETLHLPYAAGFAALVGVTYARKVAEEKYPNLEAVPAAVLEYMEDIKSVGYRVIDRLVLG